MAEQRLYLVSERRHQTLGTGFFTTTIAPDELADDELLRRLFASQRGADAIEGVLVLAPEAPGMRYAGRLYFHPTEAWTQIDLTEFLIGVCLRQRGVWYYSEGLLQLP